MADAQDDEKRALRAEVAWVYRKWGIAGALPLRVMMRDS